MYLAPTPHTVSERFAWSMNALVYAIGSRSRSGLLFIIGMLICGKVNKVRNAFLSILGRIENGTLRKSAVRQASTLQRRPMEAAVRQGLVERAKAWAETWRNVPRTWAWLLPLVPCEAASYASQLSHLLQEEEMQLRLAAEPRLGRAFRPMCRMLGIDPAVLRLPPVERKPRRSQKVTGRPSGTHPTGQTTSDCAEWKEPSRAAIKRAIATRRSPSIEMQANSKRYPWYPTEGAGTGEAEKL
jgi:hypothetical protein